MRLYLTAKTSIPDLFIDYIQVKLKSGEEVSLNWDYSDIERTSSGFSARYKGVYFDEEHANGRIDELQDMFYIFNCQLPEGYRGRSMSVSDVVWMEGLGTFFCDSFGFKPIKFNHEKCPWRKFD